jgi:hypothetical protein
MQVLQTTTFSKAVKKLHQNQKKALDNAIKDIMQNPSIGEPKIGDLSGVFVYKFIKRLTLLAYTYNEQGITLTLLALRSHENFYRDLKKR